ncbi:hypothetical protein EZJ43_07845 [Pedobacter changchengzhani]|uniref:Uncharacterized protein n=1 Tax=Pedobacter changchengzhani TaxID=2529274 RepID=A0A4R5MLE0_9SPHI|nr:hypothetical protein [Pedobacter changchengzhani]TDG36422.1 hypothetical protein EZJ43_07845 [Pedobacter changchengzhani]
MSTQKINIIADGSIIAIANTKKYNETLNNQTNWSWKQLNTFLLETNKDNLVVFDCAYGEEWTFEFSINKENKQDFFRKFEQSIEITDNALHLITWTDLTSSLQFKNTTLPEELNNDQKINIENGFYRVIVKQLFDHEDDDYDPENKTSYIVELMSEIKNPDIKAETIIWTEDFPNDDSSFLSDEPDEEMDNFLNELLETAKKQQR